MAPSAKREYRIASGDELKVLVLGHADLTGPQKVSSDGTVSLGYVGAVPAVGLTESGFSRALEAKLVADGYLKEPHVTVTVASFGESIYVIGEVARPGAYPFKARLTVLQALALAGGATGRAAPSRARVLRPSGEAGEVKAVPVEPADVLEPDDVLVVPERVF